MRPKNIAFISPDEKASATLNAAFRKAGHYVWSAKGIDDAFQIALSQRVDVVVICSSVTPNDQSRFIGRIQQHRPKTKVCMLSQGTALMAA